MANTAAVYARIDPKLKADVEDIAFELKEPRIATAQVNRIRDSFRSLKTTVMIQSLPFFLLNKKGSYSFA